MLPDGLLHFEDFIRSYIKLENDIRHSIFNKMSEIEEKRERFNELKFKIIEVQREEIINDNGIMKGS